MGQDGHAGGSTEYHQELVGVEGSERLVISDAENWLNSEVLIASETYVSLDDWR